MKIRVLLISKKGIEQEIESVSFPHFNQALIIIYESKGYIRICDAYLIAWKPLTIFGEVGNWTALTGQPSKEIRSKKPQYGTLKFNTEDNVIRRSNLFGSHLRCVTIKFPPFTNVITNISGTTSYEGLLFDMMDLIQLESNFTYSCHNQEDGIWGTFENNEWIGLVGKLKKEEIDFAIAPLDHTYDRATAVDFCFAIISMGYHMIIHHSNRINDTWSSYIKEMSLTSWVVLIFSTLLFWIMLPFVAKTSPTETLKLSYSDTALIIIGSLCTNVEEQKATSLSTRITLTTIYFSTFLVITHYMAFLISSLTVATSNLPFTTLEGLLRNGEYEFGFQRGISLEEQFERVTNPLYKRIWNKFINNKKKLLPQTDDEGVARVKSRKYVYMQEELSFKYNYGNDCSITMLNQPYMKVPSSFAVPKGSPLRKIINYHLQKLKETGVLEKLWFKWRPKDNSCKSKNAEFFAFDIQNVLSAFVLISFFLFVSLIILIIELKMYLKIRKRKMSIPMFVPEP